MSLGVCIASMPFIFCAVKHHKARLKSISSSLSLLRLRFKTKPVSKSNSVSVLHDPESQKEGDYQYRSSLTQTRSGTVHGALPG
jgi:hypothetical protein